jgi:RES domain-containing protein
MKLFRISKCNFIEDLSGTGAALYGGRWNSKGVYVLYTASTVSLALLETIVHMPGLPKASFCQLQIEMPENSITEISEKQLPPKWNAYPPPSALQKIGNAFIKKGEFLALRIPSAIVPEEFNYLLNPAHPDFKKIKLTAKKTLSFDERLIH